MKFDDHSTLQFPLAAAPPPADVLTTRRAAQLLGVAVSTVQQWVDSGRLHSWSTPGGHRRIPLQAVRQLMNDGKGEGQAQGQAQSSAAPTLAAVLGAGYAADSVDRAPL